MAITHAVQKGNFVYVYDGNKQLFTKSGQLMGYTSGSVSTKNGSNGSFIYTYDEKGRQISCHSAR